jgi:hypothetical protein
MDWRDDLRYIRQKVDEIMSAQGDINAAVAALNVLFTDISNVIAELQAGDGTVNTAQLNAIVAQVPAIQAAVLALVAPGTTTTTTTTA